jgi:hypothetical protein
MSSSGRGYSAHSIKGVDSVNVSSLGTGPKTAEGMAETVSATWWGGLDQKIAAEPRSVSRGILRGPDTSGWSEAIKNGAGRTS